RGGERLHSRVGQEFSRGEARSRAARRVVRNMSARIAIMTSAPGWHGRRLARAFAALGVETRFVALSDCRVDLEANRYGIVVPGFKTALPDGVFVREIAAGTFEQVTFRLAVLHALAEWGVPVYNSARAIERTVDKSMTSMLLHKAGIATPGTWASEPETGARTAQHGETAHAARLSRDTEVR